MYSNVCSNVAMRWQGQKIDETGDGAALLPMKGLLRSVQTPEFEGVTFHEVGCKSALNRVPGQSNMPFAWTINPMRGCLHQCVYCFARKTHEYLDLDAGKDFDTQIVVKTNVAEVLRAELARPSWKREHVALGTSRAREPTCVCSSFALYSTIQDEARNGCRPDIFKVELTRQ